MSNLEEQVLEKKKERFIQLLNDLTGHKNLAIIDIVFYLGYTEEQHSALNKCAQGKYFPNYIIEDIDEKLEKLELGYKKPELIRPPKQSLLKEEESFYTKENSLLVLIILGDEAEISNYTKGQRPGSLDKKDEKWGLVAFRTKFADADGEFNMQYEGLPSEIKPGSLIVIKQINKQDFIPGHPYLVIDASRQIFARKLFKNNEKVRLVSDDEKSYPEFMLSFNNILALFSIKKQIEDMI